MYLYIQIETNLPYAQSEVQPIKVDWRIFEVDQITNSSEFTANYTGRLIGVNVWFENGTPTSRYLLRILVPPPYNISGISFNIKNPFVGNMTGEIETTPNLGNKFDDFQYVNGVLTVQENITRLSEYESQNPKDIIFTSELFPKGNFSTWALVWTYFSTLNRFSIPTNPFMQQTSFDTWEATYLFDSSERDYTRQNITYEDAKVNGLGFTVTIPKGYSVQNPEYRNLATDNEGNLIVTKTLQSGETFHLTVTNDERAEIKSVAGDIIIGIGVFSSVLSFFSSKIRKKIGDWRTARAS